MTAPPNQPCPCGSNRKHKHCCRALLRGAAAPSPEALMRSRYCAYATGDVAYLMASTHPAGPHWRQDPGAWARELAQFCGRAEFLGLTVQGTGLVSGEPTVSFAAELLLDGAPQVLRERSRFRRNDGRWAYLDAV